MGHPCVRELASSFPIATCSDVSVLSERGFTSACNPQPDLRRHDALHADCDCLYGHHVYLAWYDFVAAKVPLRRRIKTSNVKKPGDECPGLFCLVAEAGIEPARLF